MKFEVRWSFKALDELARAWITSDEDQRQQITASAHLVDTILSRSPDAQGESREADDRIIFIGKLGITFTVEVERRRTIVLGIWPIRNRR